MRPELRFASAPSLIAAPPTGVHVLFDNGLVGSIVKMRKLTVVSSDAACPEPLFGTGLSSVSDQLFSVPVAVVLVVVICSVHVPVEIMPVNALSGSCGLKRPKNGA